MGALLAHDLGTLNPNRVDVEEMVFVRFLPQGLESLGPKRKRLFARAGGGPGASRPAGLAGEPGID